MLRQDQLPGTTKIFVDLFLGFYLTLADEGLSGTSTPKRKRFNSMIQAAREGKIDLIVTKEVSRFARNTVDTLEYTRELRKLGIGVVFLLDNINTLDSDGELRLSIMATLAQEESRKTSARVKWGQTERMKQGVVFGGSLLGYDVVNGHMTINQEGARTVQTIFRKYLDERKGSSVIAKELRTEGFLSSRGNLKWSAPTVLKIIKNEKYCGDLIQKKTFTPDYLSHEKKNNKGQENLIILRDHHEAIIPREIWNAVQRERKRRSRGDGRSSGHGNRYPLSGKIRCAACGSSFISRMKKTKSGSPYKIWRCGKATTEGKQYTDAQGNLQGCDVGRQIREDTALDILKQSVQAIQMDHNAIICKLAYIVEDVLKGRQDNGHTQKHRLERELEMVQEKKQRTLEGFLIQSISESDYQFMNRRYDTQVKLLQEQIANLEKLDGQTTCTHRDIRDAIEGITNGSQADGSFYGQLLHHMTVYSDGRVKVALNLLPARWIFVPDGSAEYISQISVHNDSSLPMSVSSPFSSGYGMA